MIGSHSAGRKRNSRRNLAVALVVLLGLTVFVAFLGAQTTTPTGETTFKPFAFLDLSSNFTSVERVALFVVLGIAVAGLLYALILVGQVRKADQGTKKMQEIAQAVREGANAYLGAQFKKIAPLIVVIAVILYFTASSPDPGSIGAARSASSSARPSPGLSASSACASPRRATSA